jgi:hypothetical protein
MWENGVWLGLFVSSIIPFSISGMIGLKFKNFWVRLVFFLICSVFGFVLYAAFGGLWAGLHPAEDANGSLHTAFRNRLAQQIVFVLVMNWIAIWPLSKQVAEIKDRIRVTPSNSN